MDNFTHNANFQELSVMSLSVQQPSAITVDVFAEAWCHLCTLTIDDNDDDSDDDDNDDDDDDDYCMLLLLWANKYFAKNIMINVKALHKYLKHITAWW